MLLNWFFDRLKQIMTLKYYYRKRDIFEEVYQHISRIMVNSDAL